MCFDSRSAQCEPALEPCGPQVRSWPTHCGHLTLYARSWANSSHICSLFLQHDGQHDPHDEVSSYGRTASSRRARIQGQHNTVSQPRNTEEQWDRTHPAGPQALVSRQSADKAGIHRGAISSTHAEREGHVQSEPHISRCDVLISEERQPSEQVDQQHEDRGGGSISRDGHDVGVKSYPRREENASREKHSSTMSEEHRRTDSRRRATVTSEGSMRTGADGAYERHYHERWDASRGGAAYRGRGGGFRSRHGEPFGRGRGRSYGRFGRGRDFRGPDFRGRGAWRRGRGFEHRDVRDTSGPRSWDGPRRQEEGHDFRSEVRSELLQGFLAAWQFVWKIKSLWCTH